MIEGRGAGKRSVRSESLSRGEFRLRCGGGGDSVGGMTATVGVVEWSRSTEGGRGVESGGSGFREMDSEIRRREREVFLVVRVVLLWYRAGRGGGCGRGSRVEVRRGSKSGKMGSVLRRVGRSDAS